MGKKYMFTGFCIRIQVSVYMNHNDINNEYNSYLSEILGVIDRRFIDIFPILLDDLLIFYKTPLILLHGPLM